jgi:NADP-dependent aldehyde dehydrogenase
VSTSPGLDTTTVDLDTVIAAASAAAPALAATPPAQRRELLVAIADALDVAAEELVPVAQRESHLTEERLRGELSRTTFQLRLHGDTVAVGAGWPAGGRPDLRRVLVPVGPVLVFAASNFPFAFSVAGGDTAAALAAGAPVVLKAHPGHPELSARTAAIITDALAAHGAPHATFAIIYGERAGRDALLDPRIEAGAFTGSPHGGRALADLAAGRERPIPFYAEMGSVNPVFVTPAAAAARAREIATGYVDSFLLGAGQFCTKPGLLFVPASHREAVLDAAAAAVRERGAAPLLTGAIAAAHARSRSALCSHPGIRAIVGDGDSAGSGGYPDCPPPVLLATELTTLLDDVEAIAAECFGPTSIVVSYRDTGDLHAALGVFTGELSATVHGESDEPLAAELVTAVARFAGRVIWNGWSTGVAVSHAQHHGGPYPAATGVFTSVGTTSIRRFLRPVAYQNVPDALLPAPLRDDNPWGLSRRINH